MRKRWKFIILTILLVLLINIKASKAIESSTEIKYQGIDVSDWQGYINYEEVKSQGIDIIYIKSSQGSNIKDPYFETNYENAKVNGLKVGFYHFLTATNIDEAEQEAEFFFSVISRKNVGL